MNQLTLGGCRPQPLGSYLKALGVFRLVARQADREAAGWWGEDDVFVLATTMSGDDVVSFFLDAYRPSPLVAPWNGGSGFDGRTAGIADIEASSDARLASYRESIAQARALKAKVDAAALADKERKRALLEACRSWLPDEAVEWLDAAVVLSSGDPAYPPLLGTGGNVGRLELSITFMQRLVDALGLGSGRRAPSRSQREDWLRAALFADRVVTHVRGSFPMYDPGRAGGVLSSPLEKLDEDGFVNPWEFVLLLEGALVLGSAAARRLSIEGASARPAFPFMVDGAAAALPTGAAGERPRGELWAPLWRGPATYREVERLFGEGRAQWGGRQARGVIDFARAAASLGVDRGIAAFARHAFVDRHGQMPIAMPVGRISVGTASSPQVVLTEHLDGWLSAIRRLAAPAASIARGLRAVDASLLALSAAPGPAELVDVLAAVAELDAAVARSSGTRAAVAPAPRLPAMEWVPHLLPEGTNPAARIAVALASGRGAVGRSLRELVSPVVLVGRRLGWAGRPALVEGFGTRRLAELLADAHQRRMLEAVAASRAQRRAPDDAVGGDDAAAPTSAFEWSDPAEPADVMALLAGDVPLDELQRYLSVLLLFDWTGWKRADPSGPVDVAAADPLWRLLAPFFVAGSFRFGDASVVLRPDPSWPALIARGHAERAVPRALLKLRLAGLTPRVSRPVSDVDPMLLTGALLIPIARPHDVLRTVADRPKEVDH